MSDNHKLARGAGVLGAHGKLIGKTVTINSQSIRVLLRDSSGNVLFATGTVTVTDTGAGYAKGCIYIDTDVGAGTAAMYTNVGTTTSCNFDLLEAGAATTTLSSMTDTDIAAPADAEVLVYDGVNSWDNVAISGDVALTNAGVATVTDLTITSEAAGSMLYFDGANWIDLAVGTDGDVLRLSTTTPGWVDPAELPSATASLLAQTVTLEAGANDLTLSATSQTVGVATLTIPDFASVSDTFAFITLQQTLKNKFLDDASVPFVDTADTTKDLFFSLGGATTAKTMTIVSSQTLDRSLTLPDATDTLVGKATTDILTNKTLDDATCAFADTADATKDLFFSLGGATTAKTMTIVSSQTDNRSLTLPDATDTLVGKATADTFTNKTLDADGTGNVLTNVNADELDVVTTPTAADASDAVYAVPSIIMANISNQGAAVDIYTSNAPFKFHIVRAWSINASADGGTWKLNNGASGAGTDITNAVSVAASDQDIDEPTDYDNSVQSIASGGSLSIVPDGAGLLDCMVYIEIVRVA